VKIQGLRFLKECHFFEESYTAELVLLQFFIAF